jgi:peptidoglycan/LPS O-acetylase OafA/YrhL
MINPPPRPDPVTGSPRLAFVDGLRGLAAWYVVIHHAALLVPPEGLAGPFLAGRFLLRHGHSAVAVFIVVSGFCLMRTIARDPAGQSPRFLDHLRRRARRILPPYYAALILSCLAIACIPVLGRPMGVRWDRALPALQSDVILAHMALVHNVDRAWFYKIDPPMWCVATEWQLYLLFPALVAVWRRWGTRALVAASFAFGYGIAGLAIPLHNLALRDVCPWYAGLFALGMAAAAALSPSAKARAPRFRIPRTLALGLIAVLTAGWAFSAPYYRSFMISDPLVGLATAGLLVRWARRARPGNLGDPGSGQGEGTTGEPPQRSVVVRLLESRALVSLGTISYSLYLVHYPLLALADAALRGVSIGPGGRLVWLVGLASPLCIGPATLFHRAFERPFLPRRATVRETSWTPLARGIRERARPPVALRRADGDSRPMQTSRDFPSMANRG